MAQLDVHLYDRFLSPEMTTVLQVVESDASGMKIDMGSNGHLGGGVYGISLAAPAVPMSVSLFVHDPRPYYAPATLCYLHGGATTQLHVALYPLPPAGSIITRRRGGGGAPQSLLTLPEAYVLIDQQVTAHHWKDDEAEGVRRLIAAVVSVLGLTMRGPEIEKFLTAWQEKLQELGIAIANASRGGEGAPGGGQMAASASA
jgi:hypothetical protein